MTRGERTFTLFAALWGAHVLWHYTSYASYFVSPLGFAAFAAGVFLLLDPTSPARFALSCYLYLLAWFSHLPNTPNHESLGSFVALAFLGSLSWERLSKGRSYVPARAIERAAPVVRSVVLLMYFWATFHKLNRDFLFDAQASCGAVFYASFLDRLTFLPAPGPALNLTMAWFSVGVEAAIGVLLLIPRTRRWGIALGWSFHFLLTLSPKSGFYNFTSLLFLLFLVFADARLPDRLAEVWREGRVRAVALRLMSAHRWRAVPFWLGCAILLAASTALVTHHSLGELGHELYSFFSRHREVVRDQAFWPWLAWSLLLSYFVWQAFRRGRSDAYTPIGTPAAAPRALWLVTAFVFLWGATPYLGLKTENSFAMFSNLRTETRPNHLLLPVSARPFTYQADEVRVVEVVGRRANGRKLRGRILGRAYKVPYEGLRNWLRTEIRHGAQIEEVRYRRGGELIVERPGEGELFEQGMWAHKLLRFRPYRPRGAMTCEH